MAQRYLNEYKSKLILKEYGIPTGTFFLATDRDDATRISEEIGTPVAMKIVSDQIVHKTEAGGIALNVLAEDATACFDQILENAKAYCPEAVIEGILISPMAGKGVEVIIGALRDKQFGPVMMFGLGGIFVEIFKDVQFRMAPVDHKEALKLIRSIKAFPMLEGARGQTPVNLDALADCIVNCSRYIAEHDEVTDIDLNPVICTGEQVIALDAVIGLSD